MVGFYAKILMLGLAILSIVGGTILVDEAQKLVSDAEDKELVAERQREERPNLYDYNQQELRNEAERNARRAYRQPPAPSHGDSDYYYYQSHQLPRRNEP